MIRFLIEKEIKQFFRNSFLPRIIVMMPLMMMLVLPWAANQEVTELKLCVVDHDHSATSRRLINKVTAGDYFILSSAQPTYEKALQDVEHDKADLILEIPRYFERQLVRNETPQIYIAANAVNGSKGTIGTAYLSQIIAQSGAQLAEKGNAADGANIIAANALSLQYRFNPNLDYKIFMVPAMMVMILTLLAGFLPALNIVGEKEAGTMEQMNVTPVSKWAFVMSKLLPYWAMGLIVFSFCMLLAWIIYGLWPKGSLLSIYAMSGIYILVVSGFGLIISNKSDTIQQAMFVMYFFIMIFLLMSGLLTPVSSMPEWAQWIAALNPLKYFAEALRAILLKGSELADLGSCIFPLAGFALFFNTWAVLSYKKTN